VVEAAYSLYRRCNSSSRETSVNILQEICCDVLNFRFEHFREEAEKTHESTQNGL
jgi:hypothetical protein